MKYYYQIEISPEFGETEQELLEVIGEAIRDVGLSFGIKWAATIEGGEDGSV